MTTVVYTAIYGDFDTIRPQPVPVRMFTDATHPLPELADPRLAAKWWKVRPDLACPDADITVWVDGSMDVLRPDFAELCERALGDADAIFVRHPTRTDIYQEARASIALAKYDGQPLMGQVQAYRRILNHPRRWGLMHCGMLVRRNNDRIRALNDLWWTEIVRWSLQDQLSLPPMLQISPAVAFRWFPVSPIDYDQFGKRSLGWVHWGRHREPDVWRTA